MIKILNPKNDTDLTRLTEATTLAGGDKLSAETVAGAKRWISFTNLTTVIATSIANVVVPTGIMVPWLSNSAPSGWVNAPSSVGTTIGSVASAATARANADTAALYALLWGAFSNTELVIETSAGIPTTRGASAADDFSANKRLPLPNIGDRGIRGINASPIGTIGGSETVTLIEANLPPHTHNTDEPTEVVTSGASGADVSTVGAVAPVESDGGSGTSTPFSVINPYISLPFIIKL